MNTTAEVEMTLDQVVQFTRSKYFIAAFRLAVPSVLAVVSAVVAVTSWAVFDTRASATMAIDAVAEIRQVQDQRAALADIRNQLERQDREQLTAQVRQVQATVLAQQGDIGEIKGLVRQLARQETARTRIPIYGPPAEARAN